MKNALNQLAADSLMATIAKNKSIFLFQCFQILLLCLVHDYSNIHDILLFPNPFLVFFSVKLSDAKFRMENESFVTDESSEVNVAHSSSGYTFTNISQGAADTQPKTTTPTAHPSTL